MYRLNHYFCFQVGSHLAVNAFLLKLGRCMISHDVGVAHTAYIYHQLRTAIFSHHTSSFLPDSHDLFFSFISPFILLSVTHSFFYSPPIFLFLANITTKLSKLETQKSPLFPPSLDSTITVFSIWSPILSLSSDPTFQSIIHPTFGRVSWQHKSNCITALLINHGGSQWPPPLVFTASPPFLLQPHSLSSPSALWVSSRENFLPFPKSGRSCNNTVLMSFIPV